MNAIQGIWEEDIKPHWNNLPIFKKIMAAFGIALGISVVILAIILKP